MLIKIKKLRLQKSVKFITNPTLIGEMFISPTNFTMGILALVVFILTVVLIVSLNLAESSEPS